ncbi:hypothetical protein [Mammaliicoccus sciuri]|uniref:hypothetical protein n=1 Tax=Mammaliicoccus sciuri TaxID=1296 RepID=UPI002B25C764|nr:hypothetical protein [Mammaliicoccus sciuri]WQK75205.1 hypothetical protein P3U33_05605 [Mammaliicoccus sciuri]
MKIEFDYKELVINYINENNEVIDSVEYYETFDDLPSLLEQIVKDVKSGKEIIISNKNE